MKANISLLFLILILGIKNTYSQCTPPNIFLMGDPNPKVCIGSTLDLAALANPMSPATNIISYTWNGPNGFSSSGNSMTLPITDKTQFGDYYCMVMDDLFCGAVYSITISEFKPVNYVVSEINEKGDTAVLRAILSDFTSNSITYNWNTGQHTQTIKVAPPIAGSYTVNVIDNSTGCSNSSVGVLKSNAKAVYDVEGNSYDTIRIGKQTWLKQNLRSGHYSNGDSISKSSEGSIPWLNAKAGAYNFIYNTTDFKKTYGATYNRYVSLSNKICPVGWHVPNKTEWDTIINYLGGSSIAGNKLKAESGWSNEGNGTNNYNFTAYPAGGALCCVNGYVGTYANWWSTSKNGSSNSYFYSIESSQSTITSDYFLGTADDGYSIRCIKNIAANNSNFSDTLFTQNYLKNKNLTNTVNSNSIGSCDIDFSKQVYNVSISKFTITSNNSADIEWSFSQNGITKTISNNIAFINTGNNLIYQTITCNNNPKAIDSITFAAAYNIDVLTTKNELANQTIRVFPNPAKQIVTISFSNSNTINSIEIINTIGQTIFVKRIEIGNNIELFDISELPQGVYYIKIQANNSSVVRKFIKE